MRNLIILRGPEGSGRTRFVHAQKLAPWHVEQAALGRGGTDPHGGARDPITALLDERFSRGATLVLEPAGTGSDPDGPAAQDAFLLRCAERAARRGYRIVLVDFGSGGADIACRPDRAAAAFASGLPAGTLHLDPRNLRQPLADLIEPPETDLSDFRHLVAIGDIHGCLDTLRRLIGPSGPRSDTAFLLLGDYISKGPRSAGVLRQLASWFDRHPAGLFLAGNHETPLETWAQGVLPSHRTFRRTLAMDLEPAGYTAEEARSFVARLHDGLNIRFHGLRIVATHGGLAAPPAHLGLLSSRHLRNGAGGPGLDIDAAWEAAVIEGQTPEPDTVIQIHGHRNPHFFPIAAGLGSFNLDGHVEEGGELRALVLSRPSERHGRVRFRALSLAATEAARAATVGTSVPGCS